MTNWIKHFDTDGHYDYYQAETYPIRADIYKYDADEFDDVQESKRFELCVWTHLPGIPGSANGPHMRRTYHPDLDRAKAYFEQIKNDKFETTVTDTVMTHVYVNGTEIGTIKEDLGPATKILHLPFHVASVYTDQTMDCDVKRLGVPFLLRKYDEHQISNQA